MMVGGAAGAHVALNMLQPLPPLGGRESEAGRESDWVEPLGGRYAPPLGGRDEDDASPQLVGRGGPAAAPEGAALRSEYASMRPALSTGPLLLSLGARRLPAHGAASAAAAAAAAKRRCCARASSGSGGAAATGAAAPGPAHDLEGEPTLVGAGVG